MIWQYGENNFKILIADFIGKLMQWIIFYFEKKASLVQSQVMSSKVLLEVHLVLSLRRH